MCFTENKTRVCAGCPSVISHSKGIRHKCFQVQKDNTRFGACGKRDGPFETREKLGVFCFTCTWEADQERKRNKRSSKIR